MIRAPMAMAWPRRARASQPGGRLVRLFAAFAFCAAVLWHAPRAEAAPIPWRDTVVTYSSNGKPLKQVLKDIFTTQPFPMVITGDVKGSVNGEFRKPVSQVFRDLEAAYGFVWYFDGSALYISASEDLRSEIIPVSPLSADQVAAMLERLGLSEPRFPVRVSGGSAFVTGPKAYVELVAKALAVERGGQATTVTVKSGGGARAPRPSKRKLQIFQLKHAQAWDVKRFIGGREYVIPGIASILRRLAGDGVQAGDYVSQVGVDDVAGRPRMPGVLGSAGGGAYPDVAVAGASSGGAHIEADIRTNSVIVRDSEENLKYYAEIVEKLDRPQKLVELEVTIVDISSTAARDLGVELSARYPGFGRRMHRPPSPGDGLAFQGVLAGADGLLRVRIAALEQEGEAKVVSQPKILTLDNIEAVLGNEGTAYARVAGAYQTDLYPISAGLLMKITPQVVEGRKGDKVRLFVDIRDGKLDTDVEVDGLPVATRNVISTQAVVGDGQVFLVGGHRREATGTQSRGVPGLSKAPVIGALFRRTGRKNELTERLLMITPRVVTDEIDDEPDDEELGGARAPVAVAPLPAAGKGSVPAARPSAAPSSPAAVRAALATAKPAPADKPVPVMAKSAPAPARPAPDIAKPISRAGGKTSTAASPPAASSPAARPTPAVARAVAAVAQAVAAGAEWEHADDAATLSPDASRSRQPAVARTSASTRATTTEPPAGTRRSLWDGFERGAR